MYPGF